jgi:three-Cys-motif partner protein
LAEIKETVWSIEPYTKAKHQILEEYLKAWYPILLRWQGRVLYLDGFAGPGVYSGGEEGSPLIALRTALTHKFAERFGEIVFIFIEKNPDRANMLRGVIKSKFGSLPKNFVCDVHSAEFALTLEQGLNDLEKRGAKLAPTFAFLDPFGFSGFPLRVVKRLLGYDMAETLITFMVGFVNRFASEQSETVTELFGTDEWKRISDSIDLTNRERLWINLYESQLGKAGAKYFRSFQMIGERNQTIYYLVYATKDPKGMAVMKDAMWKVDRRGTYRFSDITDPGQSYIIDYSQDEVWIPAAANEVYHHFRGETVSCEAVNTFVTVDTRFRFRKAILRHLEDSGRISKVTGRTSQVISGRVHHHFLGRTVTWAKTSVVSIFGN